MKKAIAIKVFLLLLLNQALAQRSIQAPSSLTTYLIDDGKGVASATVKLNYLVRRSGDEVMFSICYSDILINADAGYYYNGRKYGSEVPGLIEMLSGVKASYPEVHFDIYYGSSKQGSFTYSISARNDLGVYTGDFHIFKTTKNNGDNAGWRLVATGMKSFNYGITWMKLNDLIIAYERDKKLKTEYQDLIREADRLYHSKQLKQAFTAYTKAANHRLADRYPSTQIESIKVQLAKDDKETSFKNAMDNGQAAENAHDFTLALSYYNSAAQMGVNDHQAKNGASRVQRAINDLKRKQENELKNKEKEQKREQEEIENQKLKEKTEADQILKDKERDLEQQNKAELEKLKEELDQQQKKKLEEEMNEKIRAEAAERKRLEKEEEQKEKNERSDRRKYDSKTIDRYEEHMSFDPVLFDEHVAKAEMYYDKAKGIKPFEALQLKSEWWDSNPYMESFRDDLNEPRRQQAWQKSQELLYSMESQYENAKYYYMAAIQYADRDSRQHKYLLAQIERINDMIDFQKTMIKASRMGEEQRKKNYETAKVYKYLNQIQNNHEKATNTYYILTQDYLYPNLNSKVKGSENALQRQYDFERRLNEADQQLRTDNLITGVTSQLAMSAVMDESKTTQAYGNHAMGLNLFAFTGWAAYPVVANEIPTQGYIPQTFTRGLNVAPFQGGFDWWMNRSKNWDLGLTGDLILGVMPMKGYKNFFFSYGGNLKFNIGIKAIKLAFEADWHRRSGSYYYDQDVALSDNNNPYQQPTDVILQGKFNYAVLKAGAGLHISMADESDDGYIRLLIYAEKPSFHTSYNFKNPILSGGGQVVFRGGITISGEFSGNYPVAGKAENVLRAYEKNDFYKITFGKTWTIGKTN